MFLIEIDEETGLIADVPTNSGWKAIKAFFILYKKKGIQALTAVALVVDYQSPIRHYKQKDRLERASDEIYGKRNAIDFESDIVKDALEKYKDLQFDPDLETEKINNEIKIRLIDKINTANQLDDDTAIGKYRKAMEDHEKAVTSFNLRFDKKSVLEKAVTSTGYELSRIETDIKSRKKSKFVDHGDGLENPDRLGLNSKI